MRTLLKVACLMVAGAFLTTHRANAQTSLSAGDISLLSMYTDNSDAFSFVTWVELSPSTVIKFTDNGWSNTQFRTGEGVITWSNSTAGVISAGSVIVITNATSYFVDLGSVAPLSGTFAMVDPDQLLAYQGTEASPNFLFALDSSSGWETTVLTTSESARPTGLIDFVTAIPLGTNTWANNASIDNSRYIGPRTGLTIEQYKTAITTPSNWEFTDTRFAGSPSSVDFVIVPEPSSMLLVGLGLAGAVCLRRRRR